MAKVALVTGAAGQDGAYLCRLLLEKGYEVYGTSRHPDLPNLTRLAELGVQHDVRWVGLDLLDEASVSLAIERVRPDEVYNLAAQSSVTLSFERPVHTGDADGLGVARLLESIRQHAPACRFFQASSSELFGRAPAPQNEETPFRPISPYGAAKLYGHWIVRCYREAHGLYACSGILFNHESPLRGMEFVTRKITATLALIQCGERDTLELGNIDAQRDWGFAGDYVEGMWRMLQHEEADDYVLATGRAETVRGFVDLAARAAGLDLEWNQNGACDRTNGRPVVRMNPAFDRPAEANLTLGDASKARERLGWRPTVGLEALAAMMVEADLKRAACGTLLW